MDVRQTTNIMRIPETYLDELRLAGLLVSDPWEDDHPFMPSCVGVAKPVHVAGNRQPSRATRWGMGDIVDTPTLNFFYSDGNWHVVCHEYKPGPGPGDFHDQWSTGEEAIRDILDFFFGEPARMNARSRAAQTHTPGSANR